MSDADPTSPRRELGLALALCLLGAALLLVSAARTWTGVQLPAEPPLPGRELTFSGADLAPGLRPLGLLGLAGIAALAATRRTGRVLVGALLLVAGVAAVALAGGALADISAAATGSTRGRSQLLAPGAALEPTGWPLAAVAGGLVLAAAGLLVAARGRRWAALGARYDAPARRAERERLPARPEVAAWEALDRGEDPTTARPPDGP